MGFVFTFCLDFIPGTEAYIFFICYNIRGSDVF